MQLHVTNPDDVPAVPHRRRVPQGVPRSGPGAFRWRAKAYEFVDQIPAIDLLAGSAARARGHRGRREPRRARRALAARRGRVRRGARRVPALRYDARSRCSAAASTRRTSRTSWSRSTCSRPSPSTSCGSCRSTRTRSARPSRRTSIGSRCASSRRPRSGRAPGSVAPRRSSRSRPGFAGSRTLELIEHLRRAAPRARAAAGGRRRHPRRDRQVAPLGRRGRGGAADRHRAQPATPVPDGSVATGVTMPEISSTAIARARRPDPGARAALPRRGPRASALLPRVGVAVYRRAQRPVPASDPDQRAAQPHHVRRRRRPGRDRARRRACASAACPCSGCGRASRAAARAAGSAAGVAAFSSAPPDVLLEAEVVLLAVRDQRDRRGRADAARHRPGRQAPRAAPLRGRDRGARRCSAASPTRSAGIGTMHPLSRDRRWPGRDARAQGHRVRRRGRRGRPRGGDQARRRARRHRARRSRARRWRAITPPRRSRRTTSSPRSTPRRPCSRARACRRRRPRRRSCRSPRARSRNVAAHGTTDGLTGPVRRGDAATIQRHLEALQGRPELVEIYRALARRAVEIAARIDGRDAPDRAGLDAIRALLR